MVVKNEEKRLSKLNKRHHYSKLLQKQKMPEAPLSCEAGSTQKGPNSSRAKPSKIGQQ
jgi:hypothetical protein